MRPASMTIMSSPYSKTIMLRPISPNPPKGINRRPSCCIGMPPDRKKEVSTYPSLYLLHQLSSILHGEFCSLNGSFYDDPYCSLFDPQGSPRHDRPCPIDGDGA